MTGRYIRYKYKSCFIKNVLFGRDRHRWTQTEYFTETRLASQLSGQPGGLEEVRCRQDTKAGTALLSSFTAQIGIQSEKKKLLEREIKIQVAG